MGSSTISQFDFSKGSRKTRRKLQPKLINEARNSLLAFTLATKPDFQVNWHHELLASYLDKVATGEIRRLMVFMPPRHGKSELVSRRFPAYLLGRNPDARIISTSYAHALAASMNRDVQRIMTDDTYGLIFPGTRLSGKRTVTATDSNWLRNREEFEVVERRGYYKCAGVGGGITGRGFSHGFIDDPTKDEADASSIVMSQAQWEWYTSTFLTREEGEGAQILVVTRWSLHDLAARILEVEGDQWEVLSLPAIAEGELHPLDPRSEGEALWPEHKSVDELMKLKHTMPQSQWQALYQQRPVPKGGAMFKPREWIKPANWVKALPAGIKTAWYWDNAGTEGGGANSSGMLGGFHEGRFYMIKSVAGQWSSANREARKRAEAEWARATFGTTTIYNEQEPGSAGKEQFENTSRNLAGFAAKADKVTGSKESRADTLAAQMEVGNVYVYAPDGADNSWINGLFDELESFPKGKRKDRVDATTGCYNMLAQRKPSGGLEKWL